MEYFSSKLEEKKFYKEFEETYKKVGSSYEYIILQYNPNLTSEEIYHISRSIVFYSMLFNRKSSFPIHPTLVLSIIAVESNFNPRAVSYKGAQGLGQLMPFKAQELGIKDFVFHPIYNIYGTVRTLCGLLDRYSKFGYPNQYYLAIAAYNAGAGAVEKYGGIPPYKETIDYVNKVTYYYRYFYYSMRLGP